MPSGLAASAVGALLPALGVPATALPTPALRATVLSTTVLSTSSLSTTALSTGGGLQRADLVAALVVLVVTASLPLYLYGAWIVIDAEVVTWSVLVRHLRFIAAALLTTTVPIATWMVPRLLEGFSGLIAVHVFFGLQAYALLLFGLTGIVHIFRAKRRHSLYEEPDQDVALSDLHENVDAWRFRLRVGVFGFLLCWIVAYLLGMLLFAGRIV